MAGYSLSRTLALGVNSRFKYRNLIYEEGGA